MYLCLAVMARLNVPFLGGSWIELPDQFRIQHEYIHNPLYPKIAVGIRA